MPEISAYSQSSTLQIFSFSFVLFSAVFVSFFPIFRKISNFNWPRLGGTARTDGTARTGPSRGQLKFEIFKLGVESSENGPKAHQGRPKRSKTVRKRVENGPRKVCNGPKRFENGAKSSETVRKRSETLHKRPKSSETVRVRVWLNLLKSKIFSETPLRRTLTDFIIVGALISRRPPSLISRSPTQYAVG